LNGNLRQTPIEFLNLSNISHRANANRVIVVCDPLLPGAFLAMPLQSSLINSSLILVFQLNSQAVSFLRVSHPLRPLAGTIEIPPSPSSFGFTSKIGLSLSSKSMNKIGDMRNGMDALKMGKIID
jgi:hypothetical protein